MASIFASPASGLFGAFAHQGGVVPFRPGAPMDPFSIVPRMHAGGEIDWAAGERPIVAKVGEVVGWPSQMREAFGGGHTIVNHNDFRGVRAEDRAAIEQMLDERDAKLVAQMSQQDAAVMKSTNNGFKARMKRYQVHGK